MDPNEALARFRAALSAYHGTYQHEDDSVFLEHAFAAMEAAEALDEWLSRGGFLPTAWAAAIPTDTDAIEVTGG